VIKHDSYYFLQGKQIAVSSAERTIPDTFNELMLIAKIENK